MKLTRCLALLFAAVLCPGCAATPYRPAGSGDKGYSDIRLAQDVFEVMFKGNGESTAERVQQLTLLRAAEVAGASGYKWFAIIQEERRSRRSTRTTRQTVTEGNRQTTDQATQSEAGRFLGAGYAVRIPPVRHKGFDRQLQFRIQGFNEKPNGVYVFDVALLQQSIRAKYKIK
jgi:hypothetical protein